MAGTVVDAGQPTLRDMMAVNAPEAPLAAFDAGPGRPCDSQFPDHQGLTDFPALWAARMAWEAQVRARWAYAWADAMLAARGGA